MKQGTVVKIRLNPEDVMACIDIVEASKILLPGMSIAQVVRLALTGFCEAARSQGIVPTHDGFDFERIMSKFGGASQARKRAVSDVVESVELSRVLADKPASPTKVAFSIHTSDGPTQLDMKKARVLRRVMELGDKQKVDPDNFSEAEQYSLDLLNAAFDKMITGVDVDLSGLLS